MATAFDNLAPRVMRELISDFDLTVEQAAGILGNLGAESGLRAIQELRPTIRGSRGGFGWAQWTGPRRVAFERWARARGFDFTSYEANYGYLKAELTDTVPDLKFSHAVTQLKKTTTVRAAVETFEAHYEKAGIKRMEARLNFAQRAIALYSTSHASDPVKETPAMPNPSLPDTAAKPWYKSKAVVGGIMAIALPLLSAAFPALKLVDPNSAADLVLKAIQIIGPVVGGGLAIFGRVQAVQPIAGSKAAGIVVDGQAERQAAGTADMGDEGPRIMSMPLEAVLAELPVVIDALNQLRQAAAPGPVEVTVAPPHGIGEAMPLRSGAV